VRFDQFTDPVKTNLAFKLLGIDHGAFLLLKSNKKGLASLKKKLALASKLQTNI
jgi:hypothetical protein